jgi:RNA polymerase sigma-70 factor (sigma-E family)
MEVSRRIAPRATSVGAPTQVPPEATRDDVVTALFDLHYATLVRTARLIVDDSATAEDVVMDAFTSLHRRWHTLRDPNEAHRYLRSCVLNGARSQLRRRRVRLLHTVNAPAEPASATDVATDGSNHAAVMAAIRALPTRQRQVLVMRFYLDMAEAEVADLLEISIGSVKQHSARALAAVGRALEVTE